MELEQLHSTGMCGIVSHKAIKPFSKFWDLARLQIQRVNCCLQSNLITFVISPNSFGPWEDR